MSLEMDFGSYTRRLSPCFSGRISERVAMKQYTTFKIGGMAEVMIWPRSIGDLEAALDLAGEMGLPWRTIGSGSNLLVGDGGVKEILVNLADAFQAADFGQEEGAGAGEGTIVAAIEAGVKIAKVVKSAQSLGLSGLEWAAAIPGAIGGALVMNAGSLGSCMADSVEWIRWLAPGEGVKTVEAGEARFAYRRLERPAGAVILGCGLRFKVEDPRAIRERIVKGLKWRRQTQPLALPSAGSVFKNPADDYAGRMIEAAGLKGKRAGDAQISEVHANFIVNRGRARSRDVIELIELARAEAERRFGVDLELELEVIGEELS